MKFTLGTQVWDTDKMRDMDMSTREEHGVKIDGVYMTPTTKRVFVQTYSIWDRGDGCVIGEQWHEANLSEIASLATRFDKAELLDLLEDVPTSQY